MYRVEKVWSCVYLYTCKMIDYGGDGNWIEKD